MRRGGFGSRAQIGDALWRSTEIIGRSMKLRERRDEVLDSEGLATWLAAIASRDTDALALLYGQTSPRLMAVLLRLLRRRELAEEVLHDVYLRIWDRAGSFDPS